MIKRVIKELVPIAPIILVLLSIGLVVSLEIIGVIDYGWLVVIALFLLAVRLIIREMS